MGCILNLKINVLRKKACEQVNLLQCQYKAVKLLHRRAFYLLFYLVDSVSYKNPQFFHFIHSQVW